MFKTLCKAVNKDLKKTLLCNKIFVRSRWGFLERSIILWGTEYKKYLFLWLFFWVLLIANIILWQPWVFPYRSLIPNLNALLNRQDILLTGQLTLVGIVYPLVIGLISILFQNKSSKGKLFPIYRMYSGFMFAGLSGLSLAVFIIVGYLLKSAIIDEVYVAICLVSLLWFIANLALSGWFFTKTIKMVDDISRSRLVSRFSINQSCQDIRLVLSDLLCVSATDTGLLINPSPNVLDVSSMCYSTHGFNELALKVHPEKSLKDIRYWLINTAIRLQIFILNCRKKTGCQLVITLGRQSMTSEFVAIGKFTGFEINPISRVLIRASYLFSNRRLDPGGGLSDARDIFVGNVIDAARDRDIASFKNAVSELEIWHTTIAQALVFENNENQSDNWLLLPTDHGWGPTILDQMLKQYFQIVRQAIELIPENISFYQVMLRIHRSIFSSRKSMTYKEARSLLRASYYMWYFLIEWRAYNCRSNDMRIVSNFEDILYDFVGFWEGWLIHIKSEPREDNRASIAHHSIFAHLEYTALSIILALRFHNFQAAGWGVDMLNNWLQNLCPSGHFRGVYDCQSELINHCLLLKDNQEHGIWRIILGDTDKAEIDSFGIASRNAQLDIRVITACYLLLKPYDEQKNLIADYVQALLSGSRIHPSASIDKSFESIDNAGDLVGVYFRHRDYLFHGGGSYGAWLSQILKSFGQINKERNVPGRVYSGWGVEAPHIMHRAYVEIGIYFSKESWQLPSKWRNILATVAFTQQAHNSLVEDLKDWVRLAGIEKNFLLVDEEQLESRRDNFVTSLNSLIADLKKTHAQSVNAAEINDGILNELSIAASAGFPTQDDIAFPITLFRHIDFEFTGRNVSEFNLKVAGYAKADIALGIESDRAVNEQEWIADNISNNLRDNIIRNILKAEPSETHTYQEITSLIHGVLTFSRVLDSPILIVGSSPVANNLTKAAYDTKFDLAHQISFHDGFEYEYICHIGKCIVYRMGFYDLEFCLLASRNLFNKIGFKRISNNSYVSVDFEADRDDGTRGTLEFIYSMHIELDQAIPCYGFKLSSDG